MPVGMEKDFTPHPPALTGLSSTGDSTDHTAAERGWTNTTGSAQGPCPLPAFQPPAPTYVVCQALELPPSSGHETPVLPAVCHTWPELRAARLVEWRAAFGLVRHPRRAARTPASQAARGPSPKISRIPCRRARPAITNRGRWILGYQVRQSCFSERSTDPLVVGNRSHSQDAGRVTEVFVRECDAYAPPCPHFQTGIPSLRALSLRFSTIPDPGKRIRPIGMASSS